MNFSPFVLIASGNLHAVPREVHEGTLAPANLINKSSFTGPASWQLRSTFARRKEKLSFTNRRKQNVCPRQRLSQRQKQQLPGLTLNERRDDGRATVWIVCYTVLVLKMGFGRSPCTRHAKHACDPSRPALLFSGNSGARSVQVTEKFSRLWID